MFDGVKAWMLNRLIKKKAAEAGPEAPQIPKEMLELIFKQLDARYVTQDAAKEAFKEAIKHFEDEIIPIKQDVETAKQYLLKGLKVQAGSASGGRPLKIGKILTDNKPVAELIDNALENPEIIKALLEKATGNNGGPKPEVEGW